MSTRKAFRGIASGKAHPIIINGVPYEAIKDAVRRTDLRECEVRRMIKVGEATKISVAKYMELTGSDAAVNENIEPTRNFTSWGSIQTLTIAG